MALSTVKYYSDYGQGTTGIHGLEAQRVRTREQVSRVPNPQHLGGSVNECAGRCLADVWLEIPDRPWIVFGGMGRRYCNTRTHDATVLQLITIASSARYCGENAHDARVIQ